MNEPSHRWSTWGGVAFQNIKTKIMWFSSAIYSFKQKIDVINMKHWIDVVGKQSEFNFYLVYIIYYVVIPVNTFDHFPRNFRTKEYMDNCVSNINILRKQFKISVKWKADFIRRPVGYGVEI